jgi:hypothetical protein
MADGRREDVEGVGGSKGTADEARMEGAVEASNGTALISQPRRKGGEEETRASAVWVDLSSIVVCRDRLHCCGIFKL